MTSVRVDRDCALASRLRAAAEVLLPHAHLSDDAGVLLDLLVRSVKADLAADRMWLLWTAVSSVFPTNDEVRAALRAVELADADEGALWLLDNCLEPAAAYGTPARTIRIRTNAVFVDVDFSARFDVHTGIQRVVRSTLPHWAATHDIVTTTWTPFQGALRTLTDDEQSRVLRWKQWREQLGTQPEPEDVDEAQWSVVVPWRSVVVIPEVPFQSVCDRLATLAEHSGNPVVAIGYDCIPIVSANLVPLDEPNRFVKYLTAVKHMKRVAGISVSATAEFDGFSHMLATQGLPGPAVTECALPAETPTELPARPSGGRPLVLCIGSFEPRKNQLALLHAAEVLWREGHDFELRFVGGGGVSREFPTAVRRLAGRGRPVGIATAITDTELDAAYAQARFTVFPSTHEGYGLPIAESLAHGTPVITTDYGSTREIGIAGGTVLIDPRDDLALTEAMRKLLTDDERLGKLRLEIFERPLRSWRDYADQLWSGIVAPELAEVSG